MADPVTIQCPGACTVTVVHDLALPIFSLGLEEAAQISGAVLLIWVVGYAFRMLIRTLNVDGGSTNTEETL